MRGRARVVACVALGLVVWQFGLFAPQAEASLDLILADSPDILSGYITVGYDHQTDRLNADGWALQLYDGSPTPHNISEGQFTLRAQINDSGELQPGGTLSITGTVVAAGFTSGILLTGTLTKLGYGDAGEALEFLFDVTGGDAEPLYTASVFPGGLIRNRSRAGEQ